MTNNTLIIQSHAEMLPHAWLQSCLDSVRTWSYFNDYEYRFINNELFDLIDIGHRQKFSERKALLSDLARLHAIRKGLNQGYERVVWLDADFLIFAPRSFALPKPGELPEAYALGREVWVQPRSDNPAKLQAHVKVHNAFLLFDRGNRFLDFYIENAERFLLSAEPSVPEQFIGPKLLTALHNVIQCPVQETAGMLSPEVVLDLLSEGDRTCAFNLLRKKSPEKLAAANLCCSSVVSGKISDAQMTELIELLVNGETVI